MEKKFVGIIIGSILILSLIGIVSAVEITTQDAIEDVVNFPQDNWFGRLISKIKLSIFKIGSFTVAGDILGCAKYPSDTWKFKAGQTFTVEVDGGDAGFVNWFRGSPIDGYYSKHPGDSRQWMPPEVYIEDGRTSKVSWTCDASKYWFEGFYIPLISKGDCYVDLYLCDNLPCYYDNDCASGEFCDKSVSELYDATGGGGVCLEMLPTHKTKVYRCYDGTKTYLGEVSYGDSNFCSDTDDSKYLIGTTDQCLSYEPSACYETPIECDSHDSYKCYDNDVYWYDSCGDKEERKTECGVLGCSGGVCNVPTNGETCIDLGTDMNACYNRVDCIWTRFSNCKTIQDAGCTGMREIDCLQGTDCEWTGTTCRAKTILTNLDAVIYDIEVPTSVGAGEEVIVEFKVKNKGDTGRYLIEAGIIPKPTAEDWGFTYILGEVRWLDWLTHKNVECCEGQPNVFAETTKLTSGEIAGFKLKIPKAPYSEIEDLCYDNVYWDGEGEYVLYIIVKTGCWPDGKDVAYETKIITISGTGVVNGEVGLSKTLTWSEYYSINDEKLAGGIFGGKRYLCFSDSDCELKKDYNVSCNKDEDVQERFFDGVQDKCESFTEGTGLIGNLVSKTIKLLVNPCKRFASGVEFYTSVFGIKPGVCIAESTTWYGKILDGALRMVGGMGLPAQYVLIITVMILITLMGVIIKFTTGK